MASALECQYTQQKEVDLNGINLYQTKTVDGINLNQAVEITQEKLTLKIKNNLAIPVQLSVAYHLNSDQIEDKDVNTILNIKANELITHRSRFEDDCEAYSCELEDITIQYLIPTILPLDICKLCEGKTCLNDGVLCTSSTQCGGANCVRGVCSNAETCFQENCNCAENEIQCDNNKQCVPRKVIPLDAQPICNKSEECVSQYLDPHTHLCAKSPLKVQEELNQKVVEESLKAQNEQQSRKRIIWIVIIVVAVIFLLICGLFMKAISDEKKGKENFLTIFLRKK